MSTTSPSTLILSSLAKCECYPFYPIPAETAPGFLVTIPDRAYFGVCLFLRSFIYGWWQLAFLQGAGHATKLTVDLFEIHGDFFPLQGTSHPVAEYLSFFFVGIRVVIAGTARQDVLNTLFI